MNILEVSKQSLSSLKANRLRSFLTLVAIVVGVFAIMSSSTAVSVIDSYFKETLSLMGGDVVTIQRNKAVNFGPPDRSERNRKRITFDTYETLRGKLRLARVMGPNEYFNTAAIRYKEVETDPNIAVRGVNEFYLELNAKELSAGRNFTESDILYGRNVCLIGEDVRKLLFENERAIGKEIRFDGLPYRIIGVLEKTGAVFGESQDDLVLIPYTKALNVYGGGSWRNISIQVKAPGVMNVNTMIDEIIGLMRTIRKVAPGDPNDFEVVTNDSIGSVFDNFTQYLFYFGFGVGFIALLGAGIGVMNIMLVSVKERTKEIGVRKAIGAKKKDIVMQFLLEAVFICQIGGLFGIVLGIAGGNVLAIFMETSIVIPWLTAFFGVIGLTFIGLIFGVFPAFKASKLDPIESLRYE